MFKPPHFIEQSNFESHFVLFQTTIVKRCQMCQSRNPRTSNSTAPLAMDRTSGAAAKHGRSHSITNKILWTNDKWWQMNTRVRHATPFLPHGSVSERGRSDFDCRDPSQPLQFGSVHCITGSAMMGHTLRGCLGGGTLGMHPRKSLVIASAK